MKTTSLYIISILIAQFTFGQIKNLSKNQVLNDSSSLFQSLTHSNICEKITLAQHNIVDIIELKGFARLILFSISKDSKTTLFIPIINGNAKNSLENNINTLNAQLELIKLKYQCK